MRILQDSDQLERAIEVAELNTEINPTEWRTWYNLGNAQLSAGRTRDAIESFRACLALNDPTNFNTNFLIRRVAELEGRLSGDGG